MRDLLPGTAIFLIFLSLFFVWGESRAQTPTSGYSTTLGALGTCPSPETVTGSAASICTRFVARAMECDRQDRWDYDAGTSAVSVGNCPFRQKDTWNNNNVVFNGTISVTMTAELTCPGGSTLSGGTCVCGAETTWNGASCGATCPSGASGGWNQAKPSSSVLDATCVNGCTMTPSGCNGDGKTGSVFCFGSGTGQTCAGSGAPTPPAAPAGSCAQGSCQAIINGTATCIPCGSAGTESLGIGQGQKQNADGTTTGQRKETTCKDGICTDTTTTETRNGAGELVGDPLVETDTRAKTPGDDPQSDYCRSNPLAVSCSQLGASQDTVPIVTQTHALSSIAPVSVGPAGSCPADIPLPKGAAYSFAPMCSLASGLRPVIIALAWLGAGLIVLGWNND